MENNIAVIIGLLIIWAFGLITASAQINIKLPDINIKKTEVKKSDVKKPESKNNEMTNNQIKNNNTSRSKAVYEDQLPTNVPVFLKNSVHVKIQLTDEYWKMKGQRNYTSWVPLIRFSQFYNHEKSLKYTVEYFNPDGSAWYSETLEESGRNADRTVLYQSPSPYSTGVLDTKTTDKTGVFGFKITKTDTNEVLFQGKFKVGKFSRSYSAADKNKNGFYVDHDWVLPFSTIGFHFSSIKIGGVPPLVNVWLKGDLDKSNLEGRIFYKGQQISSTNEGSVNSVEDRVDEYVVAFKQPHIWKLWKFQWEKFLLDNNGGFNRDYYPNAHYFDKNPGDYAVKIYHNGTQIRELGFTVGTDGKIVAPAHTKDIPLPYHTLVLPTKIMGTEKWDSLGWKTNAFYGNPLTGFEIK